MMSRTSWVIVALALGGCDQPSDADETVVTKAALSSVAPVQSRTQQREAHRARIDDLKQRIQAMGEGAEKNALLARLEDAKSAYLSTHEGQLVAAAAVPDDASRTFQGMSVQQRTSLLSKMAAYDMKDPAHVARWAQIKHQELGR